MYVSYIQVKIKYKIQTKLFVNYNNLLMFIEM